jgi:hypothetical protein
MFSPLKWVWTVLQLAGPLFDLAPGYHGWHSVSLR